VAASDSRRRFWVQARAALSNRAFGGRSRQYSATFNLRPWTALTLSAAPTYLRSRTIAQYLSTQADATATATFDSRYVFGELEQTEWSIPLRVNLVLTPRLSLQLYTQALLSTGDYPTIRELLAPRTYDFPVYGTDAARSRTCGCRSTTSTPTAPDRGVSAFPSPTSTSSRCG
jgi:hypothetical protein